MIFLGEIDRPGQCPPGLRPFPISIPSIVRFATAMPLRPNFSFLQINILNVNIQGDPLLSVTRDGENHIFRNNHQQSSLWPIHRAPGYDSYSSSAHNICEATERSVEVQTRIRHKLDEACANPGSIFGIDVVAQLATNILSLVEVRPRICPPLS